MAGITEDPRLDSKEILRVATKLNGELEGLDIFQHIAVVNILNQLVQHRGMQLDKRAAEKEKRIADEEALASAPVNPHLKQ